LPNLAVSDIDFEVKSCFVQAISNFMLV